MAKPLDRSATQELGDAISEHLAVISTYFKPHMKLSFLARDPNHPDGSRNVLVSNDNLDGIIEAIERSRMPAHITEHRV